MDMWLLDAVSWRKCARLSILTCIVNSTNVRWYLKDKELYRMFCKWPIYNSSHHQIHRVILCHLNLDVNQVFWQPELKSALYKSQIRELNFITLIISWGLAVIEIILFHMKEHVLINYCRRSMQKTYTQIYSLKELKNPYKPDTELLLGLLKNNQPNF